MSAHVRRAVIPLIALASACGAPASDAVPTFTRDVAPIVSAHCTGCHRPGQIAPFSLVAYEDVQARGPQNRPRDRDTAMPPWLPNPDHGQFAGARRMSDQEIATVRNWLTNGAPRGRPEDAAPPAAPPEQGWHLGKPDIVVNLPASR